MVMPLVDLTPAWSTFSDYRASVVQRMPTFLRARYVVSTIICWCSHAFGVGGDLSAKQGELFAEQELQPVHEPYLIPVPSRAAVVLPALSEFSPSYGNLGTGILAPRHCRRSQQEIKCCLVASTTEPVT